ncbi:hypothetical protein BDF20DRAFT_1004238 [Mycotypha africana]|uniref:uncharacterized protein n=1 Tax=Mycotypha africana TaxID=64632 RepID=UPI0023004F6B|nr:uncharacterized protein BDF20DRAFT_1004238 [Mycotypha africana]KAI8968380.1 hypothetical protein BDF20DRAFT_1004238 [Mycotypha africana]
MPSREVYLEAKLKKKQQKNKEIQFMIAVFRHAHKGSYLCPEYNAKKRKSGKDNYETKQAKDKGKKRRLEARKASPSNTVCNNCNGVEMKEVRISDGSSVYGTKACKTCGIIWQRDVNAAKNMLTIANSVWPPRHFLSPSP